MLFQSQKFTSKFQTQLMFFYCIHLPQTLKPLIDGRYNHGGDRCNLCELDLYLQKRMKEKKKINSLFLKEFAKTSSKYFSLQDSPI